MTMDTRNNIIAIIAAGTLALLLALSLVGIIILALAHDGQLANQAMSTFTQIITIAAPAAAALAGVDRVMTGLTARTSLTSAAAVSVAAASSGATPTTPMPVDGASDPAGANASVL